MIRIEDVLVKPVQTEKSVGMETGSKYTFVVHNNASKVDVTAAVKEFYGAEVVSVNIIKLPKKTRTIGTWKRNDEASSNEKSNCYIASGKNIGF